MAGSSSNFVSKEQADEEISLKTAETEVNWSFMVLTWKTLGALTSEARADDRVAEKIPAVIRGPKADTRLITCTT